MPIRREKLLTKPIPRIYKKSAENMLLYAWVKAQRQLIPTMTVEQAIWSYFKQFEIDDWDIECAVVTFCRMEKEYYEDFKNETTKANINHS